MLVDQLGGVPRLVANDNALIFELVVDKGAIRERAGKGTGAATILVNKLD